MPTPNLAATLDHTLLRPDCTEAQIIQLCQEARTYGFASACVPPCYVPVAARELSGSEVAVCTVIGFPLGYSSSRGKFREAEIALAEGATELDMVLNISLLKSGQLDAVRAEIEDLTDLAEAHGALLKVIIETALLTEEGMETAARLCAEAGAHFVKTSTGFASRGASVADVELLRRVLPPHIRIKASGGIRTRDQALALLAAGADRLGTSNSLAILQEDESPLS
ncbi:deoxyribose-phosphate aldolase [Hymenobacter sp. UV11]|uniref:deoxyribose-phosphate aldolase n=1 Tax=Hymenobacter sp. UV11 TaxID=1849735 RepID=UPI00105D1D3B|nr:deoxyribose-phosphate aldolase [Hymenobacter sp. UV11]TDN38375.1 deoxyribose-phosphate aldolase [Hymenobacter sp. UV11]TFZ68027.1 deoxyribose-phosphate aldolase [Hymenobacter sp. UV11]